MHWSAVGPNLLSRLRRHCLGKTASFGHGRQRFGQGFGQQLSCDNWLSRLGVPLRTKIFSLSPRIDEDPCPWCSEPEAIEYTDKDVEPSQNVALAINALASAKPSYTCYPIFSILTCLVCGKPCYYVKLTFIRKAAVSKDRAEKHFWPNAVEHADSRVTVTLLTDIPELPRAWILSRIKTPKRPLDQHQFGLFRLPDTGDIPDDQTIPLLKAAWPLVTTRFNKRLPQRPSIDRFLAAIESGDIKLVERLIAKGVSVHGDPIIDEVPMALAIENGHVPIVALLIRHGIDPRYSDDIPLGHAVSWKQHEVLKFLAATAFAPDRWRGRTLLDLQKEADLIEQNIQSHSLNGIEEALLRTVRLVLFDAAMTCWEHVRPAPPKITISDSPAKWKAL